MKFICNTFTGVFKPLSLYNISVGKHPVFSYKFYLSKHSHLVGRENKHSKPYLLGNVFLYFYLKNPYPKFVTPFFNTLYYLSCIFELNVDCCVVFNLRVYQFLKQLMYLYADKVLKEYFIKLYLMLFHRNINYLCNNCVTKLQLKYCIRTPIRVCEYFG